MGKDCPLKVNQNLAAKIGIIPTMADRFASAERLEDALLVHSTSFFAVDEIDTLFASLQEHGDSAMEKVYAALLQFATSSDTIYACRKKAIQQTGSKACKFDKIRACGIYEPHLTLLGTSISAYVYAALSPLTIESGLLSRCLVFESGARVKAGTPHFEQFSDAILNDASYLASLGGFEGLALENLDAPLPQPEPYTVNETDETKTVRALVVADCEALYDASKENAAKALWTLGEEKTSKLALLYTISESPREPLITPAAVEWAWAVVSHLTKRMLFQASVYVHDNEFDALRQKVLRQLRNAGGEMLHGHLLRNMHVEAEQMRRVIDTLAQSELILVIPLQKGGLKFRLA